MHHSSHFSRSGVYFDLLEPDQVPVGWIVLVHGGSLTGSCYLRTADGRLGWAHRFVDREFAVVVVDWPGVGRSGSTTRMIDGTTVSDALAEIVLALPQAAFVMVHSMSGPYGFRMIEQIGTSIRGLIAIAPGPPGNLQSPAQVISRAADETIVSGTSGPFAIPTSGDWMPAAPFIQAKFVGESRRFPEIDMNEFLRTLTPIPSRLVRERLNVDDSQLRVLDSTPFESKPVLVVTGSDDSEHSKQFDARTASWLADLGADVTFNFLDEAEFAGNGHCPMLEANSDEIASLIADWLDQNKQ